MEEADKDWMMIRLVDGLMFLLVLAYPGSPGQRAVNDCCCVVVCCGQMAGWIKMPLDTKVGLSPGNIVLDVDPAPPPLKGHSPKFLAYVLCSQTAGWPKMPLDMEVGLSSGDFVFDGDPAPPEKRAQPPPSFWPMSIVAKRLDGSRCLLVVGTEVNLGPGNVVLDGVAAPPPNRVTGPQFSVHVYCGQTAGWMKTPLGMEVDLIPGHIVLDRNPALPSPSPRKGHSSPPSFRPMFIVATVAHLSYC